MFECAIVAKEGLGWVGSFFLQAFCVGDFDVRCGMI